MNTVAAPRAVRCTLECRDGQAVLMLAGDWLLAQGSGANTALLRELRAMDVRELVFDCSALGAWDSLLVTLLYRLEACCDEAGVAVRRGGLPAGALRLLDLARTGTISVAGSAIARPLDVLLILGHDGTPRTSADPETQRAIGTSVVRIPSLAERREDIPSLALQLLALQSRRVEVEARAMELLSLRTYVSDVAELANVITQAASATGKLTFAAVAALA